MFILRRTADHREHQLRDVIARLGAERDKANERGDALLADLCAAYAARDEAILTQEATEDAYRAIKDRADDAERRAEVAEQLIADYQRRAGRAPSVQVEHPQPYTPDDVARHLEDGCETCVAALPDESRLFLGKVAHVARDEGSVVALFAILHELDRRNTTHEEPSR